MESVRMMLMPWYMEIKFIHLFAVMAWIWSTSVAYMYYLVPVFKAWRRNPDDIGIMVLRDWVMDRFDEGAKIEHIAFPVIMVSGPLLYLAAGWNTSSTWLTLKLLIVFGLFLPIEFLDYHLSHLGGNKHAVLAQQGPEAHERKIRQHWWFFLITTPLITYFAVIVVFLAVTKPGLAS
ncbi:MAG: hypothetical protein D6160_21265 [Ketobacter sp.]|nr:MAG: hypothetical protein D6160_21265 [Ketobacter sp.]